MADWWSSRLLGDAWTFCFSQASFKVFLEKNPCGKTCIHMSFKLIFFIAFSLAMYAM